MLQFQPGLRRLIRAQIENTRAAVKLRTGTRHLQRPPLPEEVPVTGQLAP